MTDRKTLLKEAIKKFEQSTRNANDYMDFMVIVRKSLLQGDGLVWSQVLEILNEVLPSKQTEQCDWIIMEEGY